MVRFILIIVCVAFCLISIHSCDLREPLFLAKCDGDCAAVSGYLLTGDGNDPVKNVTMKVRRYEYIYGSLTESKIVARTKTNSDGFYDLKFKAEAEGHYEVIIENINEYYQLHDKEFHEFALPSDLTNDSIISINYIMPFKAQLILSYDEYKEVENYYTLDIMSPMGVNFDQQYGYSLSWSEALSEYMHILEVAALVPIYIQKTSIIDDTTYLYEHDTISLGRNITYEYDLSFAQ